MSKTDLVPPASAPAATPEPEKFAATNESLAAHDWRYDQKLTPEMRAKVSRPAAPTGEAAETLHAAASDLRHVANGGSCAPETLLAHADALLTTQATALAALRARVEEIERALHDLGDTLEPLALVLAMGAPSRPQDLLAEIQRLNRLIGTVVDRRPPGLRAALAPRQPTQEDTDR
jgi:hypothetical protein